MRKKLLNAKVGKKLSLSFTIIIAIFMVAIVCSIVFLFQVADKLTQFYNTPYQNRVAILELRRDIQSASKNILYSLTTEDLDKVENCLETSSSEFDDAETKMEFLGENFTNAILLSNLATAFDDLLTASDRLMEYARLNQNVEALKYYDNEYMAATKEMETAAGDIVTFTENKSTNDYNAAMRMKFWHWLSWQF